MDAMSLILQTRELKLRDRLGFSSKWSPRQSHLLTSPLAHLLTLSWVGSTSPGSHGGGRRKVGRVERGRSNVVPN